MIAPPWTKARRPATAIPCNARGEGEGPFMLVESAAPKRASTAGQARNNSPIAAAVRDGEE